jgi:hypothetical protein
VASVRLALAALLLGVILALVPARTAQVNGFKAEAGMITVLSTHTAWCSQGNLLTTVLSGSSTADVSDPSVLMEVLNANRCRQAGRPARVLALVLLVVGALIGRRGARHSDRHALA